jgi:hypothetical protein
MSMDESLNKAVSGLKNVFGFASDSARLAKEAVTKAAKIDDGTEIGSLKAKVIILLDEKRRQVLALGFFHSAMTPDMINTNPEGHQTKIVQMSLELQRVEQELNTAIHRLDALGVRTRLVKR